MSRVMKNLKGLSSYVAGGYTTLSNWPSFFLDLIRMESGLRTKSNFYLLRDGTKINILKNSKRLNYVFYSVFIKGEYDSRERFNIKENDVVVDIGAHMGFFTIKAARQAKNGRVYAFEPFSVHFNILKTNIKQNNIDNVEVFNEAVSDKSGELNFYYTNEGDLSDTSLYKINPGRKTYEEKIKSISLDEFFQNREIKVCNFMKLDCEGAEYNILMSASKSTLEKIQRIAMEWHRFADEHDPQKLAEFLKDSGFKLIEPESYDHKGGFLYAYR